MTHWEDLKPYLDGGADRWAQAVGIEIPAGNWVLLSRYRVREAGTVARPTQLEAGWDAFHFPSPPQAPIGVGGHPVDLHRARRPERLISEFIHEQADHNLAHWHDAGRRLDQTRGRSFGSLESVRERHDHQLVSVYGTAVHGWMPNSADEDTRQP